MKAKSTRSVKCAASGASVYSATRCLASFSSAWVGLGGRPCWACVRWRSGGGWSSPSSLGRGEGAAHDPVRLVRVRQPMLRVLGARLALGVVLGPLPEGEDGLPRLLDDLLAELDRLGQDDLLLGVQERHLADLLEVHPDRVVDADHVGGDRVQLLLGGLLRLLRVELGGRLLPGCLSASSTATSTPSSAATRPAGVRGGSSPRPWGHAVFVDAAALAAFEDGGDELLVGGVGRRAGPPAGVARG